MHEPDEGFSGTRPNFVSKLFRISALRPFEVTFAGFPRKIQGGAARASACRFAGDKSPLKVIESLLNNVLKADKYEI